MMIHDSICLHPTFLSFIREKDPESDLSETAQADAAAAYLNGYVASFIKNGTLHLWFEEVATVERLGQVIGSGLAALLPESERGGTDTYGDIAAKTAVFLDRLQKAGRL